MSEEYDCEDKCPSCGSSDRKLLGTDYEQEEGFTRSFKCESCKAEYYEQWVRAGYKYGYTCHKN